MKREIEIDFLDLDEVKFFVWERKKSIEVVDSQVKSLEMGDYLPPVEVGKFGENEFYLEEGKILFWDSYQRIVDGGHNRALAHYLAGRRLPVVITKKYKERPSKYKEGPLKTRNYLKLEWVELISNGLELQQRRERCGAYR